MLDKVEVWRITRANVAIILHMKPADVDDMPIADIEDVMAIHQANQELDAWAKSKAFRKNND